jgi:outer membrane murein-binding lipoprotein Lpp
MKAKKIISQKTVKNFGVKKDTLLTIRHDDFGAILEDISGKFDVMIEGQNILTERADRLEVRMGSVETKVDNLETKVDNLETKVDSLETTMNSKFDTVFDYLSRIDDELQDIKKELERLSLTKADKTEIKELSYRVSNLEREIAEMRRNVKA